jgi:hypothetical protein
MTREYREIEWLVRLSRLDAAARPVQPEQTGGLNEDALWAMFTDNRIEVRATIEAQERARLGALQDLATKLRRKELRQRIMAFWREAAGTRRLRQGTIIVDDADVELLDDRGGFLQDQKSGSLVGLSLHSQFERRLPARSATIHKAMASLRMNDVETLTRWAGAIARVASNSRRSRPSRARISAHSR